MPGPIRLVLVEDNQVFREALELLLGLRSDIEVVGKGNRPTRDRVERQGREQVARALRMAEPVDLSRLDEAGADEDGGVGALRHRAHGLRRRAPILSRTPIRRGDGDREDDEAQRDQAP